MPSAAARRATTRVPLLALCLALAACASTPPPPLALPADAEQAQRTESNGDVITEYRVAGQLRMVKIQPLRGPAYYLYEQGGRIVSSREGDNPPQTYFKLFSW